MPYSPHLSLDTPTNQNAKIWRYVSFPKFISMLDHNALYFTRSDKFIDQYEGKYPIANLKKLDGLSEPDKNTALNNMKQMELFAKSWLRINSWNMLDYESAGLWNQYVGNNGVAIQSTFERLVNSFDKAAEFVNIGVVKYFDHEVDLISQQNLYYLFSHKKRNYDYEKELRAFVSVPTPEAGPMDFSNFPSGWHVSSNLDVLIEKVVLYPNASEWIVEIVKSIMKKYSLAKEVHHSELNEKEST
jgi:hypothetical protein